MYERHRVDPHLKMKRLSTLLSTLLNHTSKESRKASSGIGETSFTETDRLTLQDAVIGKVVTRFPPEASGYMHIGHAKAALINSMLRDKYKGQLIMRFDDTNPAKEKGEYEAAILKDLQWLGISWDRGPTYTSDYFPVMLQYARRLLDQGKAYVDFTPVEEMRRCREALVPTPCRDHSVAQNVALWEHEMLPGTALGETCCVRAKIDITAANGTMRDPTIYRTVLHPPHPRTGHTHKVYPTYDFACPIVDALEGVTHALRTSEYRDRDVQYAWVVEALGLRRPRLDDYSRLNMEYSIMSKRKLTKLVEGGVVDGWADPRFPTVQGLARRGLSAEALREFVEIQGMSKVVNVMEWSKLWAFNTRLLDPVARRLTALDTEGRVRCTVVGEGGEVRKGERAWHKKNPALGVKPLYFGNEIWLEGADVALLREGEEVTLMDWGNAFITGIKMTHDGVSGEFAYCAATLNLSGDVKRTKYKLSWLTCAAPSVDVHCVEFDHLLKVRKPDGEEFDLDSSVNEKSKFEQNLIGEIGFEMLDRGEKIQIERRGYYIVESLPTLNSPIVLYAIPDGGNKINHLSAKAKWISKLPPISSVLKGSATPQTGMTLEQKRAAKKAAKGTKKRT